MKLLSLLKPKRKSRHSGFAPRSGIQKQSGILKKPGVSFSHSTTPEKAYSRFPTQTSGNQILLNKINSRKRGIKSPRIVTRKYRLPIRIFFVFLLLGAVSFLVYKYIYISPVFSVRFVDIVGGGRFVNVEDLRAISEQKSKGQSIFKVSPKDIENSILSNFLGAKTAEVSIDYPDRIVIKIEERIPLAIINSGKQSPSYLIDNEGYVLGEVSGEFENLPKIIYEGDIKIGAFLNDRIVPVSIDILRETENKGLDISSVSFKNRYSTVYLGHTVVFLSNQKDIKESVETLEKLYKTLLLEGKSIAKIDLRYDKVIVLYE